MDSRQIKDQLPRTVFFFVGTPEEAKHLFASRWPEAHVVCDPHQVFYKEMSIPRATFGQLFGPANFACGLRALAKGNFVGMPSSDPWQLSAAFFVQNGHVLREHRANHGADWPNLLHFAAA
jgi:hypothetical protein